jgi:hypothetical protein
MVIVGLQLYDYYHVSFSLNLERELRIVWHSTCIQFGRSLNVRVRKSAHVDVKQYVLRQEQGAAASDHIQSHR